MANNPLYQKYQSSGESLRQVPQQTEEERKKLEEEKARAEQLAKANANATGSQIVKPDDKGEIREGSSNVRINRLTGLPFGYQPGDKLPEELSTRTKDFAAESVQRRDEATAKAVDSLKAIASRFDQDNSQKKNPDYIAEGNAAREEYQSSLVRPGGEQATQAAKERMVRNQEQARRGKEEYFGKIDTDAMRSLAINRPEVYELIKQKVAEETGGDAYYRLQDRDTVAPKLKFDPATYTQAPSFLERLISRSVKSNPYRLVTRGNAS